MPSLIQKRLSRAGLSRQTAKGTAMVAATYGYGVDGGSIFKLTLDEAEIPLTWSNRDILGYDRSGVKPGQSIGTVATPSVIGLMLLGILGADVVTGTAAPYTHTLTPAAVLPYLTAFGFFGTADWAQLTDAKISSLELSWTAAGKVTVKAEIMAITPALLGVAYVETNLEVLSAVGYFTAGKGTFLVEGVAAQVASGSIKFDTHITQPIVAATVLPADVVEGKLEVTWSLKILPTDTSLFRGVYFGAETPGALSAITPSPRLGAVSVAFTGPTTESLTIASPVVRFMVDFPESSPEGGAAELTLAGTSLLPTTGPSVTATLLNAVAVY